MDIIEIANKASKIPGVKWLLKPFYYRYKRYLNDKVVNNFKENGLDIIKEYDEIMTKSGYNYFLIFGSLLGAVREKGLIKHDLDLDTAMWIDDADDNLKPTLEKAGFKLTHSFEVDDGKKGREWTFEKKGISIDIFFFYPPVRENPYCCDFPDGDGDDCVTWSQLVRKYGGVKPRRVELPITHDFIRVPFETLQLPIPINSHEILKLHYGVNYMTPIAKWTRDVKKEPPTHLVMWDGMLAVYKEFH